jgi:hypothetical protein
MGEVVDEALAARAPDRTEQREASAALLVSAESGRASRFDETPPVGAEEPRDLWLLIVAAGRTSL